MTHLAHKVFYRVFFLSGSLSQSQLNDFNMKKGSAKKTSFMTNAALVIILLSIATISYVDAATRRWCDCKLRGYEFSGSQKLNQPPIKLLRCFGSCSGSCKSVDELGNSARKRNIQNWNDESKNNWHEEKVMYESWFLKKMRLFLTNLI